MVNLDAVFESVGATKRKTARPLHVAWRRVRNQSRTSVLAFKRTRDTPSTWFHHMWWGHFVTAARVILTNAYMI